MRAGPRASGLGPRVFLAVIAFGCASRTTGRCDDPLVVTGWAEPGTRVEIRRTGSELLLASDVADGTGQVMFEIRSGGAVVKAFAVVGDRRLAFEPLCRGVEDVSFR